ncbi:MAG: hypothetical protein GXX85_00830 [Ignavibacteria bacterium]|nr:hypothetical protein [Ignavibacteria bacterium]
MKKIYFIIFVSLLCKLSNAQFVVEDPSLIALMTQLNAQVTTNQLTNQVEFVEQTTTLAKTLEHMKEVKKKLQQVNSLLNEAIYYKDLVKTQLRIVKYQMDYIENIKADKKVTVKELATVSEIFTSMLSRTQSLLSFATDLLTDSKYEMSDSDRLGQLKKISEEMTGIFNELNMTINSFNYVRKQKDLVDILENW